MFVYGVFRNTHNVVVSCCVLVGAVSELVWVVSDQDTKLTVFCPDRDTKCFVSDQDTKFACPGQVCPVSEPGQRTLNDTIRTQILGHTDFFLGICPAPDTIDLCQRRTRTHAGH